MTDWLRADRQEPSITIGGREVPIAIRRHARAKRLTMRLAQDGNEVRITLPRWGRTLDALAFARARCDWLEAQLRSIPEPVAIAPGATIAFRGRALTIAWQADGPRSPSVDGEALSCGGPRCALESRIRRWLEGEAMRLSAADLAFFCVRGHHPMPKLRLSRARRRWGSCSSERANALGKSRPIVRINWRLVMAPDFVRRSVVAHEVAHLTHFDHSPAFHALLGTLFDGDLYKADRWLKENGRGLYAAFV